MWDTFHCVSVFGVIRLYSMFYRFFLGSSVLESSAYTVRWTIRCFVLFFLRLFAVMISIGWPGEAGGVSSDVSFKIS
jgi:hypothetical protein